MIYRNFKPFGSIVYTITKRYDTCTRSQGTRHLCLLIFPDNAVLQSTTMSQWGVIEMVACLLWFVCHRNFQSMLVANATIYMGMPPSVVRRR